MLNNSILFEDAIPQRQLLHKMLQKYQKTTTIISGCRSRKRRDMVYVMKIDKVLGERCWIQYL
jgi:hypothetical protein